MTLAMRRNYLVSEIAVRAALLIVFLISDAVEPFHRKIQPEEQWLYRYPNDTSYVTLRILVVFITFTPLVVFSAVALIHRDKTDVIQGGLGLTLAIAITGAVTNLIKVAVGRPRPDYLWRCYPDGNFDLDRPCTGSPTQVTDGLKSFPSGHSSIAFSVLGFTSLYLASRLQVFVAGRGHSWRLCLASLPLVAATAVAISRTCDYHHHWQDVLVGSLLGITVAAVCYNQYFGVNHCAQSPSHCAHCSSPMMLASLVPPRSSSAFHSADGESLLVAVKSV